MSDAAQADDNLQAARALLGELLAHRGEAHRMARRARQLRESNGFAQTIDDAIRARRDR